MRKPLALATILLLFACDTSSGIGALLACSQTPESRAVATPANLPVVPHEQKWGIYRLDIDSHKVELLFTSATEISYMRLNTAGDQFVFSQTVGGDAHDQEEIFTLTSDGRRLRRLTDNGYWDLYPTWSPDGARIAFLSQRNGNLGIFVMNADGSHPTKVFDSSSDEADIDWVDNLVAFTKESRIWIMRPDGSDSRPVSDPPRAGEWGAAILPFGDYDPRISPDGSKVAFERLLGDESPHGNYDLFAIDLRTSEETRLTHTRFAQGLASWSHSGQQLAYIVASIDQVGQYDLYIMNTDGTGSRNITPSYFPPQFLCHWAVFSRDDTAVFFIGEWWPEE